MAFSLRQRLASFGHAIRGLAAIIRTQPNARIHLAAAILVVPAGFACGLSRGDWIAVVLAIALVWTAEALNTALEFLADEVSAERRALIGAAKDAAAAGVLCAAAGSVAVGILVFGPHMKAFLALP